MIKKLELRVVLMLLKIKLGSAQISVLKPAKNNLHKSLVQYFCKQTHHRRLAESYYYLIACDCFNAILNRIFPNDTQFFEDNLSFNYI